MLRLVLGVQFVFCFVSMLLTSLFALSLSGVSLVGFDLSHEVAEKMPAAVLLILIGACIDVGKYLFWAQRRHSNYYGLISLILTGFSLLASCAFFISAEYRAIQDLRYETVEYRAHEQRVEAIQREIGHQERLLEKRLASDYHKQWVEGEKNAQRISELRAAMTSLIESSSNTGEEVAIALMPITQFFTGLGGMLGIGTNTVRNISFGLLALLLEVCTLGAISLASSIRAETETGDDHYKPPIAVDIEDDREVRDKAVTLSNDIIQGKVQPVLRKIRAAQYGLDIDTIRQVLKGLYLAGMIEKDVRNSYKLVDPP